ncbi:MAG: Transcriptional repressor MprA [bacterium ADurb.Bin363]|nr:MAG: Transcriptional repressor MprA [bacterium ADurb.Bin363]
MSKSKQEIIDELSQLCTDMAEKFFQAIYRRPSKADQIPLSHLKVLMFLSKKESFKMKDITEELGIASSSATDLIDKLIKEHLVERYRKPDDRRVVKVKLSEKGRNLIVELKEMKRKFWVTIIENISEEDREDLVRYHRKFYNIIGKMAEEGIFI